MTLRQEAFDLAARKGCRIQTNWRFDQISDVEVLAPEGYLFDGEFTSLVCVNWKDVLNRLPQYELEKEDSKNESRESHC